MDSWVGAWRTPFSQRGLCTVQAATVTRTLARRKGSFGKRTWLSTVAVFECDPVAPMPTIDARMRDRRQLLFHGFETELWSFRSRVRPCSAKVRDWETIRDTTPRLFPRPLTRSRSLRKITI